MTELNHPYLGPKYATFTQAFDVSGRVALITGAGGLLGIRHAQAILEVGGIPVINDYTQDKIDRVLDELREEFGDRKMLGVRADITDAQQVQEMMDRITGTFGHLDVLINNAANNPKMTGDEDAALSRLENFPVDTWNADIGVGLTGAFLCCRAAGGVMRKQGRGVLVNIASDMGIISPDQRVYLQPGQNEGDQSYKPITYAAVKGALISMTRWLATYYAPYGIRANTLTPASVFDGQPRYLVEHLAERIPLGRMSHPDEFKGAVGSSRVDLQACKLEYSIVSPK